MNYNFKIYIKLIEIKWLYIKLYKFISQTRWYLTFESLTQVVLII